MPDVAVDPVDALYKLIHPIFQDCVGGIRGPWDCTTPYVVNDFVYATNGSVVVRQPASFEIIEAARVVPVKRGKRYSTCGSIYVADDFRREPLVLPDLSRFSHCEWCDGSGHQGPYKCSECGHKSVVETCPKCDGHGSGGGKSEWKAVGGFKISHYYLLMLINHGASLFAPLQSKPACSLKFTAGTEVDGRLMPMA